MATSEGGSLCKSCGDLIPAGAPGCTRCGYHTSASQAAKPTVPVAGPRSVDDMIVRDAASFKQSWQELAFRIMAIVILVEGALEIVGGVIYLAQSGGNAGGASVGHGATAAFVGIGLVMEWPFASFALKVECWFTMILGILLVIDSIGMLTTKFGWLLLFAGAVIAGIFGFALYLVNTVGAD